MSNTLLLGPDNAVYEVPADKLDGALQAGGRPVTPGTDAGTVLLASPTGALVNAPFAKVPELLSAGGSVANLDPESSGKPFAERSVLMNGPDGQQYAIPQARIPEALSTGGSFFDGRAVQPARPKVPPAPQTIRDMQPEWFGNPLSLDRIRQLSGGQELLDLVTKNRSGREGFAEGFGDWGAADIPFAGTVVEGARLASLPGIAKRMQAGEQVSDQEALDLNLYLEQMRRDSNRTFLGDIGAGIRGLLTFGAEWGSITLLLGSGFGAIPGIGAAAEATTARLAATAARTAGGKLLKTLATKQAAGSIAMNATGNMLKELILKSVGEQAATSLTRKILANSAKVVANTAVAGAAGTAVDEAISRVSAAAAGFSDDVGGEGRARQINAAMNGQDMSDDKAFWLGLGNEFWGYATMGIQHSVGEGMYALKQARLARKAAQAAGGAESAAVKGAEGAAAKAAEAPVVKAAEGAAAAEAPVVKAAEGAAAETAGVPSASVLASDYNAGAVLGDRIAGRNTARLGADASAEMKAKAQELIKKQKYVAAAGAYIAKTATDMGLDVDTAAYFIKGLGYNGWVEAMASQRFGAFMRGLTGTEGDEASLKNAWAQMFPGAEPLATEAVLFALPMVATHGLHTMQLHFTGGLKNMNTRVRNLIEATTPQGAEKLAETPEQVTELMKPVHEIIDAYAATDNQKVSLLRSIVTWVQDLAMGDFSAAMHNSFDQASGAYGLPKVVTTYQVARDSAIRLGQERGLKGPELDAFADKSARGIVDQLVLYRRGTHEAGYEATPEANKQAAELLNEYAKKQNAAPVDARDLRYVPDDGQTPAHFEILRHPAEGSLDERTSETLRRMQLDTMPVGIDSIDKLTNWYKVTAAEFASDLQDPRKRAQWASRMFGSTADWQSMRDFDEFSRYILRHAEQAKLNAARFTSDVAGLHLTPSFQVQDTLGNLKKWAVKLGYDPDMLKYSMHYVSGKRGDDAAVYRLDGAGSVVSGDKAGRLQVTLRTHDIARLAGPWHIAEDSLELFRRMAASKNLGNEFALDPTEVKTSEELRRVLAAKAKNNTEMQRLLTMLHGNPRQVWELLGKLWIAKNLQALRVARPDNIYAMHELVAATSDSEVNDVLRNLDSYYGQAYLPEGQTVVPVANMEGLLKPFVNPWAKYYSQIPVTLVNALNEVAAKAKEAKPKQAANKPAEAAASEEIPVISTGGKVIETVGTSQPAKQEPAKREPERQELTPPPHDKSNTGVERRMKIDVPAAPAAAPVSEPAKAPAAEPAKTAAVEPAKASDEVMAKALAEQQSGAIAKKAAEGYGTMAEKAKAGMAALKAKLAAKKAVAEKGTSAPPPATETPPPPQPPGTSASLIVSYDPEAAVAAAFTIGNLAENLAEARVAAGLRPLTPAAVVASALAGRMGNRQLGALLYREFGNRAHTLADVAEYLADPEAINKALNKQVLTDDEGAALADDPAFLFNDDTYGPSAETEGTKNEGDNDTQAAWTGSTTKVESMSLKNPWANVIRAAYDFTTARPSVVDGKLFELLNSLGWYTKGGGALAELLRDEAKLESWLSEDSMKQDTTLPDGTVLKAADLAPLRLALGVMTQAQRQEALHRLGATIPVIRERYDAQPAASSVFGAAVTAAHANQNRSIEGDLARSLRGMFFNPDGSVNVSKFAWLYRAYWQIEPLKLGRLSTPAQKQLAAELRATYPAAYDNSATVRKYLLFMRAPVSVAHGTGPDAVAPSMAGELFGLTNREVTELAGSRAALEKWYFAIPSQPGMVRTDYSPKGVGAAVGRILFSKLDGVASVESLATQIAAGVARRNTTPEAVIESMDRSVLVRFMRDAFYGAPYSKDKLNARHTAGVGTNTEVIANLAIRGLNPQYLPTYYRTTAGTKKPSGLLRTAMWNWVEQAKTPAEFAERASRIRILDGVRYGVPDEFGRYQVQNSMEPNRLDPRNLDTYILGQFETQARDFLKRGQPTGEPFMMRTYFSTGSKLETAYVLTDVSKYESFKPWLAEVKSALEDFDAAVKGKTVGTGAYNTLAQKARERLRGLYDTMFTEARVKDVDPYMTGNPEIWSKTKKNEAGEVVSRIFDASAQNKRSSQLGTPIVRFLPGMLPEKIHVAVFEDSDKTPFADGYAAIPQKAFAEFLKAFPGLPPPDVSYMLKMGGYGLVDGDFVHIKPLYNVLDPAWSAASGKGRTENGATLSYGALQRLADEHKGPQPLWLVVGANSVKKIPGKAKVGHFDAVDGKPAYDVYELPSDVFGITSTTPVVTETKQTGTQKLTYQAVTGLTGSTNPAVEAVLRDLARRYGSLVSESLTGIDDPAAFEKIAADMDPDRFPVETALLAAGINPRLPSLAYRVRRSFVLRAMAKSQVELPGRAVFAERPDMMESVLTQTNTGNTVDETRLVRGKDGNLYVQPTTTPFHKTADGRYVAPWVIDNSSPAKPNRRLYDENITVEKVNDTALGGLPKLVRDWFQLVGSEVNQDNVTAAKELLYTLSGERDPSYLIRDLFGADLPTARKVIALLQSRLGIMRDLARPATAGDVAAGRASKLYERIVEPANTPVESITGDGVMDQDLVPVTKTVSSRGMQFKQTKGFIVPGSEIWINRSPYSGSFESGFIGRRAAPVHRDDGNIAGSYIVTNYAIQRTTGADNDFDQRSVLTHKLTKDMAGIDKDHGPNDIMDMLRQAFESSTIEQLQHAINPDRLKEALAKDPGYAEFLKTYQHTDPRKLSTYGTYIENASGSYAAKNATAAAVNTTAVISSVLTKLPELARGMPSSLFDPTRPDIQAIPLTTVNDRSSPARVNMLTDMLNMVVDGEKNPERNKWLMLDLDHAPLVMALMTMYDGVKTPEQANAALLHIARFLRESTLGKLLTDAMTGQNSPIRRTAEGLGVGINDQMKIVAAKYKLALDAMQTKPDANVAKGALASLHAMLQYVQSSNHINKAMQSFRGNPLYTYGQFRYGDTALRLARGGDLPGMPPVDPSEHPVLAAGERFMDGLRRSLYTPEASMPGSLFGTTSGQELLKALEARMHWVTKDGKRVVSEVPPYFQAGMYERLETLAETALLADVVHQLSGSKSRFLVPGLTTRVRGFEGQSERIAVRQEQNLYFEAARVLEDLQNRLPGNAFVHALVNSNAEIRADDFGADPARLELIRKDADSKDISDYERGVLLEYAIRKYKASVDGGRGNFQPLFGDQYMRQVSDAYMGLYRQWAKGAADRTAVDTLARDLYANRNAESFSGAMDFDLGAGLWTPVSRDALPFDPKQFDSGKPMRIYDAGRTIRVTVGDEMFERRRFYGTDEKGRPVLNDLYYKRQANDAALREEKAGKQKPVELAPPVEVTRAAEPVAHEATESDLGGLTDDELAHLSALANAPDFRDEQLYDHEPTDWTPQEPEAAKVVEPVKEELTPPPPKPAEPVKETQTPVLNESDFVEALLEVGGGLAGLVPGQERAALRLPRKQPDGSFALAMVYPVGKDRWVWSGLTELPVSGRIVEAINQYKSEFNRRLNATEAALARARELTGTGWNSDMAKARDLAIGLQHLGFTAAEAKEIASAQPPTDPRKALERWSQDDMERLRKFVEQEARVQNEDSTTPTAPLQGAPEPAEPVKETPRRQRLNEAEIREMGKDNNVIALADGRTGTLNAGQHEAARTVMAWAMHPDHRQSHILIGPAGTGKTTVMLKLWAQLRNSFEGPIVFAAPTHTAKEELNRRLALVGQEAFTIHSIVGMKPSRDPALFNPSDPSFVFGRFNKMPHAGLLVVDEASMMNQAFITNLLNLAHSYGTRVLFSGDNKQVNAIGHSGEPYAFTLPGAKHSELTEVMRTAGDNPLMGVFQDIREGQRTKPVGSQIPESSTLNSRGEGLLVSSDKSWVLQQALDAFRKAASVPAEERGRFARMITSTNANVDALNTWFRDQLFPNGKLADGRRMLVVPGELLIGSDNRAVDDDVIVQNGLVYEILSRGDAETREGIAGIPVKLRALHASGPVDREVFMVTGAGSKAFGDRLAQYAARIKQGGYSAKQAFEARDEFLGTFINRNPVQYSSVYGTQTQYPALDGAYATNVHKAQGSSIHNVFVDVPSINWFGQGANIPEGKKTTLDDRNRMLYTAATRAMERAIFFVDGKATPTGQQPEISYSMIAGGDGLPPGELPADIHDPKVILPFKKWRPRTLAQSRSDEAFKFAKVHAGGDEGAFGDLAKAYNASWKPTLDKLVAASEAGDMETMRAVLEKAPFGPEDKGLKSKWWSAYRRRLAEVATEKEMAPGAPPKPLPEAVFDLAEPVNPNMSDADKLDMLDAYEVAQANRYPDLTSSMIAGSPGSWVQEREFNLARLGLHGSTAMGLALQDEFNKADALLTQAVDHYNQTMSRFGQGEDNLVPVFKDGKRTKETVKLTDEEQDQVRQWLSAVTAYRMSRRNTDADRLLAHVVYGNPIDGLDANGNPAKVTSETAANVLKRFEKSTAKAKLTQAGVDTSFAAFKAMAAKEQEMYDKYFSYLPDTGYRANYAPLVYGSGYMNREQRRAIDRVRTAVEDAKYSKASDSFLTDVEYRKTDPRTNLPEPTKMQRDLFAQLVKERLQRTGATVKDEASAVALPEGSNVIDANVAIARELQWREEARSMTQGASYQPDARSVATIHLANKTARFYTGREWTNRSLPRQFDTYYEAYVTHGLKPNTMSAPELSLQYARDIFGALRRRQTLRRLVNMVDERGRPMIVAVPSDLKARNEILPESEYRMMAESLARSHGYNIDPRKPLNDQIQWLARNVLGNDYERVESPIPSIGSFMAQKGEPSRWLRHVVEQKMHWLVGDTDVAEAIQAAVQWTKLGSVGWSVFFPLSLLESAIAGTGLKNNVLLRADKWPQVWKELKSIREQMRDGSGPWRDLVDLFSRHGIKLMETAALDEPIGIVESQTKLVSDKIRRRQGEGAAKAFEALVDFWRAKKLSNVWFQDWFPAVKIWAAHRLMHEMADQGGIDIVNDHAAKELMAKRIAPIINDAYGGQNWERYSWATPKVRQVLNMALFASNWCTPFDTQALTKSGWKSHNELTIGDEIMAYDPATKSTKWSRLNDKFVREDYSGDVVYVKSYHRELAMTPEHKCVVRNHKGTESIVKAFELIPGHKIPRSAPHSSLPETKTLSDSLVVLAGWLVTDGHVKRCIKSLRSGKTIEYRYGRIKQSKPHTVALLKKHGLKWYDEPIKDTNFKCNHAPHTFLIPKKEYDALETHGLRDGKLSWEFISKLTRDQLTLLEETMMLGDGTGQRRFCGEQQEVFWMTLIRTLLGKPCTFWEQKAKGQRCWLTREISNNSVSCNNKETRHYEGGIWCPSVDTGFWVAQRNGLVFITGNTLSAWNVAGGGLLTGKLLENRMTEANQKFVAMNALAMGLVVLTLVPAALQSAIYAAAGSPDDNDTPFPWDNEDGRKGYIDFTPLARKMPWYTGDPTGKRRTYMRFGKQAYEVYDGWLVEPFNQLARKLSQPARLVLEELTGRSPGSDWNLEFQGKGLAGWLQTDKEGFDSFMTSRLGYVLQKVLPMSVLQTVRQPSLAIASFMAPTSYGKSQGAAVRELQTVLATYANDETMDKVARDPHAKANLAAVAPEILDAVARNGYDPQKALNSAKGAVLGALYQQFFTALDDKDYAKMDKIAQRVLRVGGSIQGAQASINNKMSTYNRVETPEQVAAVAQAFHVSPEEAVAKRAAAVSRKKAKTPAVEPEWLQQPGVWNP